MTLYCVTGRRCDLPSEPHYILASTLLDLALLAAELRIHIKQIEVLTDRPLTALTRDEREAGF